MATIPPLPSQPRRRRCEGRADTATPELMLLWSVHLLVSESKPDKIYIGLTNAPLDKRLAEHNASGTAYTRQYRPWRLETWLNFTNKTTARRFEGYLKQGSGFRWMKTHWLSEPRF